MSYQAEKHVMRNEDYEIDSEPDQVDQSLDEFFRNLDDLHGLTLLETEVNEEENWRDYEFQAAGSSVGVLYQLEDSEDQIEIDLEIYGAAPAVDRVYNHFSEEWLETPRIT